MNSIRIDPPDHSSWMEELLSKIKMTPFISDDIDLFDVQLPMSASACESELSYEQLNQLEEEDDFNQELTSLIKTKWFGTKRILCEKALLLENTFYKIQAGKRQPGRDTIISLALALGLNEAETTHLLGYLGYGLSKHIKRDFIILYCLERGKSPIEVNLILEKSGLRLLGPND